MSIAYSVVVPVYRGQPTLEALTTRLRAFFAKAGLTYEIIFVYDCGPDASWSLIERLRTQFGAEVIRGVRLARNFGQHNAIICGFGYARGQFILTMDEDLQHRPEDISRLIGRQAEGDFDVVYGCYDTRQHSGFRNVTSGALNWLLRVSIPDLHPDYSSFRLLKASVARHCRQMRNSYTFLDGYLTWLTRSVASVTVAHQPGEAGQSAYTVRRLIEHAINIFVTFSDLPVRLLSFTGIGVFVLTVVYSAFIIARNLLYNDLSAGFASLIIAIGLGVGLMLLGLGVVGEYVHRINLKTTRRPPFVEAEVTPLPAAANAPTDEASASS